MGIILVSRFLYFFSCLTKFVCLYFLFNEILIFILTPFSFYRIISCVLFFVFFFFMSFAIGKIEINALLERECQLNSELSVHHGFVNGSVCSFQTMVLKREIQRVRNELNVLSYMNPADFESNDSA